MDRRTRICLWIIVVGLANFMAYGAGYALIGGDAMNGYVLAGQGAQRSYFIGRGADDFPVGGGVWIYSAVHSVSIPLTVGAVLLAMLTLAKDRIVTSLRASTIRGQTFITALAVVIGVLTAGAAIYFVHFIVEQLRQ